MKRASAVAAAIVLLCLGTVAQAVTIATVPVGDAGNPGELSGSGAGGYGPDRVCGSVSYDYNIGKYEVTAGQYTEFLNAKAATDTYGLYNTNMWSSWGGCKIQRTGSQGTYRYSVAADWANRPVNFVSYWDACRFANWLCNGQGTGSTETGAYTLNNYNGRDGRTITRNPGWKWAVTSEDEWYKAAYYKGGSLDAGYWDFPTKSNTAPANRVLEADPGNSANYYVGGHCIGSPYYRTNAGEFENSASAYGTFDQAGNVWEWNETIVWTTGSDVCHDLRGGCFGDIGVFNLQAWDRHAGQPPTLDDMSFGFRVVRAVPEPSSMLTLAGGLISLLGIGRRRA